MVLPACLPCQANAMGHAGGGGETTCYKNVLSFIILCVQQSFAGIEEKKQKADGREQLSDI